MTSCTAHCYHDALRFELGVSGGQIGKSRSRIHCNESALFQVRLSGPNRTDNRFTNGGRYHVLRTDLNYTWSSCFVSRENHPEIR